MRFNQCRAVGGSAVHFLAETFTGTLFFLLLTVVAHAQTLSGQQIFKRMIRVYTGANTYQDIGQVTTDFYEDGQSAPSFTTIRTFETAYDRQSNQFKFGYKAKAVSAFSKPEEMVIWTKGPVTYQWWTINNAVSREASVTDALAGATGVSGTASRKIPGLLLSQPIEAGWGIDSLRNVKLIGQDTQDGRPCYRLTGVFWKNRVAFLWIDRQSFLLLRVDEGHHITGKKVKMSLTYRPVLNESIPANRLQFTPSRTQ